MRVIAVFVNVSSADDHACMNVVYAGLAKLAPFSYMCDKFHVSDCVKFEESSPFPYTCHKFHVSECVEFEESAAFCSKSVSAL